MPRATPRIRAFRAENGTSPFEAAKKMYALMSPRERRTMWWLIPGVTLTALVQVIGIASIMPFLALVSSPSAIEDNRFLSVLYTTLAFDDTTSFLVFIGLGVLAVMIFSNAVTAFIEWRKLRFTWSLNDSLSVRMLAEYLFKPYAFFLDENSSELAKNLLTEVKQAVTGFVIAGIQMVSKGVIAVFVLALLIAVNPLLALLTFVLLGGAYGIVFLFVRNAMSRAGRGRSESDRGRYKVASEALSGVKDIKMLGREASFIARYAVPSKNYARFMAQQQVMSMVPRYAFETIAFGGMLLIVLWLLVQNNDLSVVLPTLGVFAFASYRLLPALQALFSSMTKIRFSIPAVDVLYEDLDRNGRIRVEDRSRIEPLPFRERVELKNLTFCYQGATEPLLHNFGLTIRANTSVALVGATGSGKTTTVDLLLGLLAPQQGQLVVDGTAVTDENVAAWQKSLGYVPQEIYLADDTIAANIAFGVPEDEIDIEKVERAARLANVHEFIVDSLPKGYDTIVGERGLRLSGGQRQRLGIARAVYHDPAVLVLDEATSALDGVTEDAVFEAVDQIGQSKTLVMIAHRLTTVQKCDVIYLLDGGRIVAHGSYDELMRTSPMFQAMAKTGGLASASEVVS